LFGVHGSSFLAVKN